MYGILKLIETDKEYKNHGELVKNLCGEYHLCPIDLLEAPSWKSIQPIVVCDDEIILGDKVYHDILGIGNIVERHGEECFFKEHLSGGSIITPWKRNIPECKKILISDDQISLEIIKNIVDLKLKNNDRIEIDFKFILKKQIKQYFIVTILQLISYNDI